MLRLRSAADDDDVQQKSERGRRSRVRGAPDVPRDHVHPRRPRANGALVPRRRRRRSELPRRPGRRGRRPRRAPRHAEVGPGAAGPGPHRRRVGVHRARGRGAQARGPAGAGAPRRRRGRPGGGPARALRPGHGAHDGVQEDRRRRRGGRRRRRRVLRLLRRAAARGGRGAAGVCARLPPPVHLQVVPSESDVPAVPRRRGEASGPRASEADRRVHRGRNVM